MTYMMTQPELIQLLKDKQGEMSQQEFAEMLGITPAYLSDIYAGKRNPGPKILKALKLRKETVYGNSKG